MDRKKLHCTLISTAGRLPGILAGACYSYFAILCIADPRIVSFYDIWLLGGIVFTLWCVLKNRIPHRIRRLCRGICAAGFGAALLLLILICLPIPEPQEPAVYMIVLGGGLHSNGTLSHTVLNRLDAAASYELQHPDTLVILSNGPEQDTGRPVAPVMRDALMRRGVPPSRIILEQKSMTTIENLLYSRTIIGIIEDKPDVPCTAPVLIVSSKSHLRRALFLAQKFGYTRVEALGSSVPHPSVLNTYVREIFSYVKLGLMLAAGKLPS